MYFALGASSWSLQQAGWEMVEKSVFPSGQSIVGPKLPNPLELQALFDSNLSIDSPLTLEEDCSMKRRPNQREMVAYPRVVQDST